MATVNFVNFRCRTLEVQATGSRISIGTSRPNRRNASISPVDRRAKTAKPVNFVNFTGRSRPFQGGWPAPPPLPRRHCDRPRAVNFSEADRGSFQAMGERRRFGSTSSSVRFSAGFS
jgi:hypothetical protein